jgi:hypothetical protein
MISNHGKELLIFFSIGLRKSLGKCFPWYSEFSRIARIGCDNSGGRQFIRPDSDNL